MTCDEVLASYDAGRISAHVALARLLLAGVPRDLIASRADAVIRALLDRTGGAVDALGAVDHGGAASAAAIGAMFDRAVAVSPEASVAAYSLGDPATLARATDEIVAWLGARGLLGPDRDVVDLGCGIGRVAAAIAPLCRSVLGLDVSAGMIARARAAPAPANLRFMLTDGESLARVPDGGCDLLLAVDAFPYLVQAGLAEPHMREAARVLRPGRALAVLNLSYRGVDTDIADARRWARAYGFDISVSAATPFALWDGVCFVFARHSTSRPTAADSNEPANTASLTWS